jgi:MoaA/NifB/PqqE/SkfB family radical SAM enzyme
MKPKFFKNRYILARAKIAFAILLKGRVSFRKILNAAHCWFAQKFHFVKAAPFPFMINFELWNECNAQCTFCRTDDGVIYDQNPENKGQVPIPKGKMSLELYKEIIEQSKDHILIAVLYVNGEPLMYKGLYEAIQFASDRGVATLISTNGELLTENNIKKLLESGLDFVKIAISGFSQDIYTVQHRGCHIEKIKDNLETLARLRDLGQHKILTMLDYVYYQYNSHEYQSALDFGQRLGFMVSRRPGNLFKLSEEHPELAQHEKPQEAPKHLPVKNLCDWPWKVMTVDWNGNIYPCCDYVVWNNQEPNATFEVGKSNVKDIWNGPAVIENRTVHLTKGRGGYDICSECTRTGTAFKF